VRASITVDGAAVQRYLERAKGDVRVAAVRALKRTMQTIQSRAAKVIAEDVGIPQRRVRQAMHVRDARPEKLETELTITGKIPLADFGATQNRRGVRYRIGRRFAPHAFIVRLQSGHKGVFKRVGAKRPPPHGRYAGKTLRSGKPLTRQPIVELFGPSLPRVASQKQVDKITRAAQINELPKNIERELRFIARSGA